MTFPSMIKIKPKKQEKMAEMAYRMEVNILHHLRYPQLTQKDWGIKVQREISSSIC